MFYLKNELFVAKYLTFNTKNYTLIYCLFLVIMPDLNNSISIPNIFTPFNPEF